MEASHALELSLIHFCLVGIELRGSDVKAPYEFSMMRGCLEVSTETCRAEGRQQSLRKWYNRSLGHFGGNTMGPIVISPLTCGTFSTNHLEPQMDHADNVFFETETTESDSSACLSCCRILSVFYSHIRPSACQVHFFRF